MKKLFAIILGGLFLLPITVKADMGSPSIREVKVTPVSKEGAPIYDGENKTDKVLKSGETFTINYEEKYSDGYYGCSYESDGCVKMSDVVAVDKVKKNDNDVAKYVGRVFAKNGVEVYEGPSYIYKKTGKTIPYNADVKIADLGSSDGTWIYIEYNDISGYVDTADSAVVQLYKHKIIVTTNNKEYEEYFMTNLWERLIYVLDGGKYVAVNTYDTGYDFQYENEFKLVKECNLHKYAEAEDQEKDIIGTVNKDEKVNVIYSYGDYGYEAYYVKYGNKYGWLTSTVTRDDTDSVVSEEFECFNVDYTKLKQKSGFTTSSDWKVKANNNTVEKVEKADIVVPSNTNKDPKPTGDVITPDEDEKEDNKDDNKDEEKNNDKELIFGNWTKDQIILASCIGGAAIVITAVVTIILVNKKKNKKTKVAPKEETQTEEKDESVQE